MRSENEARTKADFAFIIVSQQIGERRRRAEFFTPIPDDEFQDWDVAKRNIQKIS